jgi:hypothetical protein
MKDGKERILTYDLDNSGEQAMHFNHNGKPIQLDDKSLHFELSI